MYDVDRVVGHHAIQGTSTHLHTTLSQATLKLGNGESARVELIPQTGNKSFCYHSDSSPQL